MQLYSLEAVEKATAQYLAHDGTMHVIREGVLLDDIVLQAPGLKTIVATAQYLNDSNSAYKIRMYRKIPWKYEKIILQACDGKHNTIDDIVSCKSCDQVLR